MNSLVWQRLHELALRLDQDGKAPEALDMSDEILRLARQGTDADAIALAMIERARVLFLRGERKQADVALKKAVRFTARQGTQHSLSIALCRLAQVFYYLADYYRSLDTWVKCLESSAESSNLRNCIDAYIGIGKVYFAFRDIDLAIHYHELAKMLIGPQPTPELNAEIHLNLSADYFEAGDYAATEYALQTAQQALSHFSNPTWEGELASRQGHLHFALGEMEKAIFQFERALAIFVAHNSLWGQLTTQLQLGRALVQQKEYDQAKALLLEAAALAQQSGLNVPALEIEYLLTTVCQTLGDFEQALQHHKHAHALSTASPLLRKRSSLQTSAHITLKRLEFPLKALKMRLHYRERRLIASMVSR